MPPPTVTIDPKATVNLVHGIPDVSVTVCVDGDVALPTFDYTDIATVRLDPKTYRVAIIPPGGTCGASAPVVPAFDVTVVAGVNYSVVAHLDASGDEDVSVLQNDTSPAAPGTARVVLHHLAQAPGVIARIGRPTPSALDITTAPLDNGDVLVVQPRVRPGNWDMRLFDEATEALALGPVAVQLRPRTAYFVYAVGALTNQFTLLVLPVGLSNF